MPNKILETKRLQFYQIDESYAAKTLAYYTRNQYHFQNAMPSISEYFLTEKYQQGILNNQRIEIEAGRQFKFWLFHKEDTNTEQIIGDISLNNIVRGAFLSCHLGYKLDKDFIKKGLMKEALTTACKYAFKILKLHRIEANIMPANQASINLAESLGFVREGFSKKYLKINGKWEDHYRYALLIG